MIGMLDGSGYQDMQASLGVKRIVDCRRSDAGKLFYKVQWKSTWEPEENLIVCPQLVEEFWSYLNRVQAEEATVSQQTRKRHHWNDVSDCAPSKLLISPSEKLSIDTDGLSMLTGFSTTLPSDDMASDNNSPWRSSIEASDSGFSSDQTGSSGADVSSLSSMNHGIADLNNIVTEISQSSVSSDKLHKCKSTSLSKSELAALKAEFATLDGSERAVSIAIQDPGTAAKLASASPPASSLQYLENFVNPYVKIIVVCKICSKEQSMKKPGNWKAHHLIHASDEEKPHKCVVCSKAFIRQDVMRKHMEKTHSHKFEVT